MNKKILILSVLSLIIFSCSKEEEKIKEGSVVFWTDESAADFLGKQKVSTLLFYVGNEYVGSCSAREYWDRAPSCGQNGAITVTKKLGNASSLSYEYYVEDERGFKRWSGIVNFVDNTCTQMQLGSN